MTQQEREAVLGALEALQIFNRSKYPCCTSINPRGYNWSEAYLDQAVPIAQEAISKLEAITTNSPRVGGDGA